jgi:hypothetical protein
MRPVVQQMGQPLSATNPAIPSPIEAANAVVPVDRPSRTAKPEIAEKIEV